jgi:hypothetical protein
MKRINVHKYNYVLGRLFIQRMLSKIQFQTDDDKKRYEQQLVHDLLDIMFETVEVLHQLNPHEQYVVRGDDRDIVALGRQLDARPPQ